MFTTLGLKSLPSVLINGHEMDKESVSDHYANNRVNQ